MRHSSLGRTESDAAPEASPEPLALSTGRTTALLKLTVCFILLVIITFVTVEGWRAWRDYRQAFAMAQDSVSNLARATAQHAEDAIRQVDVLTYGLAERVEGDGLQNLDVPRIHALLMGQAKMMPQLHGLFIYGADGNWIVTDQATTPDTANNADRDYFIYHRTHADLSVRIGQVVKSRSTGDLIIPVSRRLNNPDGSFAGVLLGTIKVSYFVDYYGDFKIDDRGALVLALRNGTILVRRPFDAQVIGQSLAQSDIFRKYLPRTSSGIAEVKAVVDGTYRLYGFSALTSYPLVVEAGISRESFIEPWRHDLLKTGFVLLVLIAGLGAFGFIVLSQLNDRIAMEQEIRLAHQAVRDMALTDSLTGLGNRRKLDMVLAQEIRRAKRQGTPLALIMIDVDHFKRFNDRYGHLAGDECLAQVAGAIQKMLKRPADLAVRYGGEEFTVVLPDTSAEGANRLAQELLEAVQALQIEHDDHPLGVITISAGLACCLPASDDVTPVELLKTADAFLYKAKHNGRNQWYAANGNSTLEELLRHISKK